jgi:hypothetical protein
MKRAFRVIAGVVFAGVVFFASTAAFAALSGESAVSSGFEPKDAPAKSTTAALSPTRSFIAPGETCTISVRVSSSGDSLGCIECWVSFDTSLVDLQLAEEGALFKAAPYPRIFFWQHIAPDTQSVEGCLLGYGTFAVAPGEIARYVFKAKKAGTCPVRITRLDLFDIRRVMYEPVVDPGAWIVIGTSTGIEPPNSGGCRLECYPNPFNPSITLVLSLPESGNGFSGAVSIGVYTPDGRLVRTLFDGDMNTGERRFVWDGRNGNGEEASSGVYFAVAKTESGTFKTKLVLVR